MGQYKVPQNVEAEDKIIGSLTIKQFIYTVIGVAWALLSFALLRKLPLVMILVGLPPTTLFLLLGLYQRHDQPFEALFLSLTSFLAKPRKRVWEKEPIVEVFKVEPPKIVKEQTQRDPQEIYSQLERLSQVVDTRGWGSKEEAVQEPTGGAVLEAGDRLVVPDLPAAAAPTPNDVSAADDILDFQNNPGAHNLGTLIQDAAKSIREEALTKLKTHRAAGPAGPVTGVPASNVVIPAADSQPQKAGRPAPNPVNQAAAGVNQPTQTGGEVSASEMTVNPLDGILKTAMENSDLSVSRIARQANRQAPLQEGQSVSIRNATDHQP